MSDNGLLSSYFPLSVTKVLQIRRNYILYEFKNDTDLMYHSLLKEYKHKKISMSKYFHFMFRETWIQYLP